MQLLGGRMGRSSMTKQERLDGISAANSTCWATVPTGSPPVLAGTPSSPRSSACLPSTPSSRLPNPKQHEPHLPGAARASLKRGEAAKEKTPSGLDHSNRAIRCEGLPHAIDLPPISVHEIVRQSFPISTAAAVAGAVGKWETPEAKAEAFSKAALSPSFP